MRKERDTSSPSSVLKNSPPACNLVPSLSMQSCITTVDLPLSNLSAYSRLNDTLPKDLLLYKGTRGGGMLHQSVRVLRRQTLPDIRNMTKENTTYTTACHICKCARVGGLFRRSSYSVLLKCVEEEQKTIERKETSLYIEQFKAGIGCE